jgi:hypothetical protein
MDLADFVSVRRVARLAAEPEKRAALDQDGSSIERRLLRLQE